MKKVFNIVALSLLIIQAQAQIKWEVISSDITLNPRVFTETATIYITTGRNDVKPVKSDDGYVTFDLDGKYTYINSNHNNFKFKNDQITNVEIQGLMFDGNELSKKEFADTLVTKYRKSIFSTLNLNQVTFSSSKRQEFDIDNNGYLFLKNQKYSTGKICCVGYDFITVLTETGDLDTYKNGDFNFLQIGSFRALDCQSLYDFVYRDFQKTLTENKSKWEQELLRANIDSLLTLLGPVDNISQISNDRKLITWKKDNTTYEIMMSSFNSRTGTTFGTSRANYMSFGTLNFSGISPFFIQGNTYRNSELSTTSSAVTTTVTQNVQNGSIFKHDTGPAISILIDANQKPVKLFHSNVFSDPRYGAPFRFVNY